MPAFARRGVTQDRIVKAIACVRSLKNMTSTDGNGGFACQPVGENGRGSLTCPCCGGKLTPAMLEALLEQARQAQPRPAPARPGSARSR